MDGAGRRDREAQRDRGTRGSVQDLLSWSTWTRLSCVFLPFSRVLRVSFRGLILSRDNVAETKYGTKVGRRQASGSSLSKFDAAYDSGVTVSRHGMSESCFPGG